MINMIYSISIFGTITVKHIQLLQVHIAIHLADRFPLLYHLKVRHLPESLKLDRLTSQFNILLRRSDLIGLNTIRSLFI